MAVEFDGGVVMGADSRTSSGSLHNRFFLSSGNFYQVDDDRLNFNKFANSGIFTDNQLTGCPL